MDLDVNIVAPDRVLWSGMASSVVAPTVEGEIGLLAGHEPVLSVLRPGEVRVQVEGGEGKSLHVNGGFISFDHNSITIVADTVEGAAV